MLTLDCLSCHTSTEVFRPLTRVDFNEGLCPACGQLRQVNMTHVITGDEPFLDRTLRSIGVPALHVLRARSATEYRFYELTGDLAEALHFAHFGSAEGVGEGAPIAVRRPRPRVRLGDPLPDPSPRPRVKLGK